VINLVPSSATLYLWCVDCAAAGEFVAVDCADGHGEDCPERICVECGAAVLIDLQIEVEQPQARVA
jgi:hypothetical protein